MAESFIYSQKDYVFNVSWASFEKSKNSLSRFDVLLRDGWDAALARGYFRYDLAHLQTRLIPGNCKYILQLNWKRLKERRTPENIVSCHMPFDPEKFNFTKVKPEEILFNFKPIKTENVLTNGFVETEDPKNEIINDASEKPGHHLVLINVSPLEYGHVLLVPDAYCGIPQRLTLVGVRLAVDLLLLSSHPGLRIGFNSLCALASVNHQHIHAWYLEHSMAIENAAVQEIRDQFYELVDFPTRAFAFQLHGTTVEAFAGLIFKVADFLQTNGVAHNFFMTRGSVFTATSNENLSTVRAYIWPRKSFTGVKLSPTDEAVPFNVAVAELAGHIPMYVPEMYEELTEDYISDQLSKVMLPDEQFTAVRDGIQSILLPSPPCLDSRPRCHVGSAEGR